MVCLSDTIGWDINICLLNFPFPKTNELYIISDSYTYDIVRNETCINKFLKSCRSITDYQYKTVGYCLKITPVKSANDIYKH